MGNQTGNTQNGKYSMKGSKTDRRIGFSQWQDIVVRNIVCFHLQVQFETSIHAFAYSKSNSVCHVKSGLIDLEFTVNSNQVFKARSKCYFRLHFVTYNGFC